MSSVWNIGTGRPVAQLALGGELRNTVEHWLAEDGLRYTIADIGGDGFPDAASPLGAEPVIIALPSAALDGDDRAMRIRLCGLTDRAPVIAIVDAETVELLPSLFDIEPAEFVALSCGKGAFMNALQEVVSPTLRERAESRTINPDVLRDEIERIAKALSALVDDNMPAEPQIHTERSAKDSARLVRNIIRRRRARAQFFPAELFADPAWDILLDLAAARFEQTSVSISSLCIAAAVPTTTALRWIKGMTAAGLLTRQDDPLDGRRSFVRLSDRTAQAMENYLTMVEEGVV